MATEKLADGIGMFGSDIRALHALIRTRLTGFIRVGYSVSRPASDHLNDLFIGLPADLYPRRSNSSPGFASL